MKFFKRQHIILVAIIFLVLPSAFGKNPQSIHDLIVRAQSASPGDQPALYVEIARREVQLADENFRAEKYEEGRKAINDLVTYSDKAGDAATKSGKHLKDTEIALRKMAAKLRDIKRIASLEDQRQVQEATDHLEQVRTDLLSHMFKGKE